MSSTCLSVPFGSLKSAHSRKFLITYVVSSVEEDQSLFQLMVVVFHVSFLQPHFISF